MCVCVCVCLSKPGLEDRQELSLFSVRNGTTPTQSLAFLRLALFVCKLRGFLHVGTENTSCAELPPWPLYPISPQAGSVLSPLIKTRFHGKGCQCVYATGRLSQYYGALLERPALASRCLQSRAG